VAKNASTGPREGVASQTISQGSTPRMMKTAKRRPQSRNQRRYFSCMVERTSALMMALSMPETVSKRQRPATIRMPDRRSMRGGTVRWWE